MKSESKRVLRYTLIGCLLMLVAVVGTGLLGISPRLPGFKDSMKAYWDVWMPQWGQNSLAYFCVTLFLLDLALTLLFFVFIALKKKPLLLLPVLGFFLSVAFLPFLMIVTIPRCEDGSIGRLAFYLLCGFSILNILAIIVFIIPIVPLFQAGFNLVKAAGGDKVEKKEDDQEEEEEKDQAAAGLSEDEVRHLVQEAIAEHEEELHKNAPAAAPKEEPVEEVEDEENDEDDDDEEEEEEFEEVEEVNELGELVKIKRRKRVHFETRLRNSEFDLRHKYYDLRDYLKWYGLKNRISIPGDTFSLKRKKYAFITIKGKHIKFYCAIDPSKYEDSPIPVERATAKKFMDVPCLLRIKSDLSYRRAKLLVDAMMQEAGFSKPEGDEPKETQHPEKN